MQWVSVRVSVIMPCFNVEKTVTYAIESLSRQTFRNFELIAVDDGSVDNTAKLLRITAKKVDFKMIVIEKKNEGVAVARNIGMDKATGKYITFLDGDDMYDETFLEILVNVMDKNDKCDVAFCSFKKISELSKKFNEKNNEKLNEQNNEKNSVKNSKKIRWMSQKELFQNLMFRNIPTSMWCYMYIRKKIVDKNLRFTENVQYGEDSEFLWKYLVNCNKGGVVDKKLYYYYNNPQSALNNLSWNKVQSADVINRIYDYMKKTEISCADDFYKYMYPRTLLAIYKMFLKNGKVKYAKKFERDYKLRKEMKVLTKSPDLKIRSTARVYIICPFICRNILKII